MPIAPLAAGAAALLLLVLAVAVRNRMVARRNRVRTAWSAIDVQLQRRHDLVPQLVAAVAGHQAYERSTLEAVTRALPKATAATGQDVATVGLAETLLTRALRPVMLDIESSPSLHAADNALRLQEDLLSTENRIAFARQHYNDEVMAFNTSRQTFPASVVAALTGVRGIGYLELELTADPAPAAAR